MSVWEDYESSEQRITVHFQLPSGVGPGMFQFEVSEDGRTLLFESEYPTCLTNVKELQAPLFAEKNPRQAELLAEAAGFNRALRQLR